MVRTHQEEIRKLQDQLHSQARQALDLHKQIVKVRTVHVVLSTPAVPAGEPSPAEFSRGFSLETRGLLSGC